MLRKQVEDLNTLSEEQGRNPDAIKAVSGLSVVTGSSRDEAEDKLEEYLSWINEDAAMTYYAMMTGVDLKKLDAEASFSDVKTEGGVRKSSVTKTFQSRKAPLTF